jgi:hypothetical protein
MTNGMTSTSNRVWIGVGIGAAIGVGLALSRRRRSHWSVARASHRVADHTSDVVAASKDIVDRIRVIYNESCKLVDQAGDLWSSGRRIVGV